MKAGARNRILAKVVSVKSDDIMSLAKFQTEGPVEMASVLTTESVRDLDLRPGDRVELIVKAVHVLVVKA
ncbi:MAG: TOBE domain-containing protein [Acidobacteriota bacterium]